MSMAIITVPAETRSKLRAQLLAAMPAMGDKVDEVVDLACHAAEQAMTTLVRVALETSPDDRVGMTAYGPAIGILAAILEGATEHLHTFGAQNGLPVSTVTMGNAA